MKSYTIAAAVLLGFLFTIAPVHAQRKFDVPPHQPAGWSGPIGAPPKKDKDNPKKDKDNPKKDKDNPKKDKDNPKKDKDNAKKDSGSDRDQRLKDKQDQINNALDRGRRLNEEYRRTGTHYSTWHDYWDIVLIELPALEEAYDRIRDEKR